MTEDDRASAQGPADHIIIRPAHKDEAPLLTEISFAAKGYWNYPLEYYAVWKNELTITPAYIANNDVLVYEDDGVAVGYYSLVELREDLRVAGIMLDKGFWLEHMFVAPQHIGKGIGTRLFDHLRRRCRARGIVRLGILADPHARGFYEKMGCEYLREVPSTIKQRTTPYLHLRI